ncbi:hypothetical protein GETHLI_24510 [Geothrix limicola]|uniref:DUF3667 domain-containing protein n=1 Tax=Geothrix limicola TaxID=2927978 RepID=A0ABQ5QIT7_9BACT|nr:DUF3667 domain-containing protein [Geothrix limicola]GLH73949.1 hypothetical protein GETHLI_24510 [Geothrix limicola]
MSDATPSQRLCLNCEAELQGTFCHRCGQKAQNRRLPLKSLLHDVMHDLWHLDHKVLESLWLLIRHPGFLAEEYLNGRRVRHLPPFRLYVLSSFALFLAFSFVPVGSKGEGGKPGHGIQLKTSGTVGGEGAAEVLTEAGVEPAAEAHPKRKANPPWVDALVARAKRAKEDPDRFYHTFLSNLSKSLFVLMPLFAGILMLLHLRSKTLFVDHMVISLHHHVVSFLVILLLMGLAALPGSGWGCLPGFLLFFAPPVHLAVSLQRLFKRGWVRSFIKAGLVSVAYGLILSVALLGLTILSLPKAG